MCSNISAYPFHSATSGISRSARPQTIPAFFPILGAPFSYCIQHPVASPRHPSLVSCRSSSWPALRLRGPVVDQPDLLDGVALLGDDAAHVLAHALDLGEAPDLRGGPGVGLRLGVGVDQLRLVRALGLLGPAFLEEVVLELGDLLEAVERKEKEEELVRQI